MKIEPFPGVLSKQCVPKTYITEKGKKTEKHFYRYVLTDEQRAWLCKWYPEEENSRLKKASGFSDGTLHRFARELGLVKSERGMRRIKKRQASHIKRLCKRNGYYDSLRGNQPSEACRRATRNMWQQVRNGEREHPFATMKKNNPRRYKQMLTRMGESRRKLFNKERRRVLFGMKRETKLCFVMCKYTKSQVCHRYNALRRGYFVMDDSSEQGGERYNIYYDDSTERSQIFENNLINDGFKVLKWEQ